MRFKEFVIEYREPKSKRAHRDGIDLEAWKDGLEFQINATAHGRDLGRVVFDVQYQGDQPVLVAKDLMILPEYRGQGIAAIMYDYAKELGYWVERSKEQTDAGKHFWDKNRGEAGQVWETELDEIARIPKSELGGWGDEGTIGPVTKKYKKKELPGGSGYTYAVDKTGKGDLEIMIFDGEEIAAELDLFETQDVLGTWGVETVVVRKPYRGQGLAKALYGIALSILKLPLEAGQMQTAQGQKMWLMLNSIPGVEVKGYNMVPTAKYQPNKNDTVVDQNKEWTRYTFPVHPGKQSMRSGRPGPGLYNSQATMIAKWTGQ